MLGQIAQTNIQLFNQMRDRGYGERDCGELCNHYQTAMGLFAGQFRPNGKPFLNHLVGTASILVEIQAERNTISAGLLHAAYSHGRLPFTLDNIPGIKRRKLKQILGEDVETLVFRYHHLPWNKQAIETLNQNTLDCETQQCLQIRLANEIEDYLDLGLLYGGKSKGWYANHSTREAIRQLAESIRQPQLYYSLANLIEQTEKSVVAENMRSDAPSSFSIPTRPTNRLKSFIKNLLRR